jgi:hypothetical protein
VSFDILSDAKPCVHLETGGAYWQWWKMPTSMVADRGLLIGSAVLVCVIGGAAFWLADDYHMNPLWVFLAMNSVGFIWVIGRRLRSHWKKPLFIVFLVAWVAIHTAVVVVLMAWVPLLYWLPLIAVELFVGFLAAYWLFGVPPPQQNQ